MRELYGPEYLPDAPRTYASKVKNAQEAHEAIRPSGDSFRTPAQTGLSGDQFRLYELIWLRTVASQMKDATGQSVSVRIGGLASDGRDVVFAASGRVITFHGFLKAYVEGTDGGKRSDDDQVPLPDLAEGEAVNAASLTAQGHETKPPARYTEATLIKELEDREIGRPSTYASIIGTIINRGYVYKKGSALVPAWIAFSVVRLLEEHFARQIDYEFTARMEDVLDEIAAGQSDRNSELAEFYFGSDDVTGLHTLVTELGDIDAKELATFPVGGPDSGIVLRVGRYGPYLEGPDRDEGNPVGKRANVPDDLPPDELTLEKARELFETPAGEEVVLGSHPETGLTVVAKNGRYGPYVTEVLPEDAKKSDRPRTGSLFKSMTIDTITPRRRGQAAEPAAGGRPRRRGRRDHRAERPLRAVPQEGHRLPHDRLGGAAAHDHRGRGARDLRPAQAARARRGDGSAQGARQRPVSGQPIVVKAGRFGEYVTDGEYNATLRKDDTVEALTPRACRRAARRAAREGSGQEDGEEDRQAGAGQEDRQEDAAKKAAAKKA